MYRYVVAVSVMFVLLFHLTWVNQSTIWELNPENHCCQEAGKITRHLSERSIEVVRHWCLSAWTVAVDTWQPPLHVSVPTDVPSCCGDQPKWVWTHHLLWPKEAIARAWPIGRTHCHGAYQSQLHMPGHQWVILGCLSAMQAAQVRQVWGGNRGVAL